MKQKQEGQLINKNLIYSRELAGSLGPVQKVSEAFLFVCLI